MPLINQLTTIYSELNVYMNETLHLIEELNNRAALEGRLLDACEDKTSTSAAFHRGAIGAYQDCIRLLTK